MFLKERLEGISIFLLVQRTISLSYSRNVKEFQHIKDKGTSQSWLSVTSNPSEKSTKKSCAHKFHSRLSCAKERVLVLLVSGTDHQAVEICIVCRQINFPHPFWKKWAP